MWGTFLKEKRDDYEHFCSLMNTDRSIHFKKPNSALKTTMSCSKPSEGGVNKLQSSRSI